MEDGHISAPTARLPRVLFRYYQVQIGSTGAIAVQALTRDSGQGDAAALRRHAGSFRRVGLELANQALGTGTLMGSRTKLSSLTWGNLERPIRIAESIVGAEPIGSVQIDRVELEKRGLGLHLGRHVHAIAYSTASKARIGR
jgi:hypothetical protein